MNGGIFDDDNAEKTDDWQVDEPALVADQSPNLSVDEGVRRSGLAWSAGITFFGAIVFMLFLGWLGDLLLGSSPWGLVVGIVIGSIIGFVQFFRLTSQIFKSDDSPQTILPLISSEEDDK